MSSSQNRGKTEIFTSLSGCKAKITMELRAYGNYAKAEDYHIERYSCSLIGEV